jgi:NAD(P)-dependent dehydrogenase (short-subunit alcohol dehydrogenase family)
MSATRILRRAVEQTVRELGKLDILVNNAAEQHPDEKSPTSRSSS